MSNQTTVIDKKFNSKKNPYPKQQINVYKFRCLFKKKIAYYFCTNRATKYLNKYSMSNKVNRIRFLKVFLQIFYFI